MAAAPPTTVLGDADFPEAWGDTVPNNAFSHRLDVVKVELPPRIKKIVFDAFAYCSNLKECVIPSYVRFDKHSFYRCEKLRATTVLGKDYFPAEWGDTVPDKAFEDRIDVVKVELPLRFKKIGDHAFNNCVNLEECVMPQGVEVGHQALFGCPKLKATTVLGEVDFPTKWGDTIPDYVFQFRLDVVKVNLPPRIKKIGSGAFYGCANLEECVVPPGVEVSRDAFAGCWNLQATTVLGEADFPTEWGDTVPDKAFENRRDLVKVKLPPRIKKIGSMAFSGCSNLEKCDFTHVRRFYESALRGCFKLKGSTVVLGDEDFPEEWGGIIPEDAFMDRHDLRVVVIPSKIKKISDRAFYNCSNLENFVIPKGVEISKDAFVWIEETSV